MYYFRIIYTYYNNFPSIINLASLFLKIKVSIKLILLILGINFDNLSEIYHFLFLLIINNYFVLYLNKFMKKI